MSEDVLQPHRIDQIIPASEFVPDSALDSLYKQAVATAKPFNWPVPERVEWEALYKAEVAASRKNHEL